MEAVFLGENRERFLSVYKNAIKDISALVPTDNEIYAKSDILSAPCKFKDIKYIFSTWGMPQFSEEEISEIFPSLKCVFYSAGSVQHFAKPFINKSVKVFSAWAANAVPVGEFTVSEIILANKGFFRLAPRYSAGEKVSSEDVKGNFGATVGIIGAGMIGKLVINMLKAYDLKIKVFDPFLTDNAANELGVKKCELKELFETCTVVSNHLANNKETENIIGKSLLLKMPENAVFINTGRGAQVVEKDLCEALKERPDITAVLDVTVCEPPEKTSEFYALKNCILTPHIAGSLGDECQRMSEYMLNEFKGYLENKPLKYEVTAKMLETMA